MRGISYPNKSKWQHQLPFVLGLNTPSPKLFYLGKRYTKGELSIFPTLYPSKISFK